MSAEVVGDGGHDANLLAKLLISGIQDRLPSPNMSEQEVREIAPEVGVVAWSRPGESGEDIGIDLLRGGLYIDPQNGRQGVIIIVERNLGGCAIYETAFGGNGPRSAEFSYDADATYPAKNVELYTRLLAVLHGTTFTASRTMMVEKMWRITSTPRNRLSAD